MTFKQYLKKVRLSSLDPGSRPLEFEEAFYKFSVFKYLNLLKKSNIDDINQIAENKVLKLFQLASEQVPAYKDFLKKNEINSQSVKTITDYQKVPPINKDNYLREYTCASLMWNGSSAGTTMISVSSGSTGKPYYWPRDLYLEHETAIMHEIFSNVFFNIRQKKTLVIDAYAMGMYVAGTFTLNSFRKIAKKGYHLLVVSPGIEDREVIQIVRDIGQQYDQVIITGYPPFVKDIIDHGEAEGIDWSQFNVKFIFGAENFSEDWRTHILKKAGVVDEKAIVSSSMNTYGSADCAILGHETPISIQIRRMVRKHELSKSIFNSEYLPTLVQYNPISRYFELVNGELIFSAQGAIPLLRYNIQDRGQLLSFNNLKSKLNKYKPKLTDSLCESVWTRMPFLTISGRTGDATTLYGLNVFPEAIKAALEYDKVINLVSGKFKMTTKNNDAYDQYLEILIELNSDRRLEQKEEVFIRDTIITFLKKMNFEYSKLYQKIGKKAEPQLVFSPRDTFKLMASKHNWVKEE